MASEVSTYDQDLAEATAATFNTWKIQGLMLAKTKANLESVVVGKREAASGRANVLVEGSAPPCLAVFCGADVDTSGCAGCSSELSALSSEP